VGSTHPCRARSQHYSVRARVRAQSKTSRAGSHNHNCMVWFRHYLVETSFGPEAVMEAATKRPRSLRRLSADGL
jgi:hypothetical protein